MQRDDDSFSDRKKSQEAKYKMDQERQFKVRSRRNKLIGLWIGGELGLSDDEQAAFGREAVVIGMDSRTEDEFLERLTKRTVDLGGRIEVADLRAELVTCEQDADRQIAEEFPAALGGDHAPVGDSPHYRK